MPCSIISMNKRTVAGILSVMMLFVVLFSSLYVAAEADHDCSGEDCQICFLIAQCENTLRQIGEGLPFGGTLTLTVIIILLTLSVRSLCLSQETPVSYKVQMNN